MDLDFSKAKWYLLGYIKNRIFSKISRNKTASLSIMGRITAANHALTSVAQYILPVFRLPVAVTRSIDKQIANFIWKGDTDGKEIHWRSWDNICKSKFFTSELGIPWKTAWKIHSQPNSLLSQIFLTKYCAKKDSLGVKPNSSSSWEWRSVLWGRDLLKQGLKWVIGNGEIINILKDLIPGISNPLRYNSLIFTRLQLKVKHLYDLNGNWRAPLLSRLSFQHKFMTLSNQ